MQSIDNVLKLRKGLKPDDPNPDIFDVLWAKKLSDTRVITTLTGNPLSFLAKKAQTAKSTKVTLEPIQAGSGDPSPTNIRPISGRGSVEIKGCGINIWNGIYEMGNILSDGTDGTSSLCQRTKGYVKVIGGKSYYIVCNDANKRCYWYDKDKQFISYEVNNISVKMAPANACYVRTMWAISSDPNPDETCSINYPSTDTQYHTYQQSNDVTITFPAVGKNLAMSINYTVTLAGSVVVTYNLNGDITINGTSVNSVGTPNIATCKQNGWFYELKAGTYTASISDPDARVEVYAIETSTLLASSNTSQTFTLTEDTVVFTRIALIVNKTYTNKVFHIQLEKGSTATTYEPYTNTVYSGTLDVETGVLTVDMGYANMGDISWQRTGGASSPSGYIFKSVSAYLPSRSVKILSSIYKTGNWQYVSQVENNGICANSSGQILVRNDTYDNNVEAFTTAMSGVQLAYELSTPITIQITPEQIQILKGQNNIWIEDEGVTIALTYKN